MKTIPASASTSAIASGVSCTATPSASSTSALPHFEVKERLPCFATRTPPAATTSAAAVEMLKVETLPPPVPQVSTRASLSGAATGIIAPRSASTPPATSDGASPLVCSAASSPPVCTSEASPDTMWPNAAAASRVVSCPPPTTFARSGTRLKSGEVATVLAFVSMSMAAGLRARREAARRRGR